MSRDDSAGKDAGRYTVQEVDGPCRWGVYGDTFGRPLLLAAFLLEEDAHRYVKAEARRDRRRGYEHA